MGVGRNRVGSECHGFRAARLRQGEPIPQVDGDASSEVGQRERALAVAAIGGADQIEESFVFGDGQ